MSSAPSPDLPAAAPPEAAFAAAASAAAPAPSDAPGTAPASKVVLYTMAALATVAVAGLASSALLWQKLSTIQEQLARQSADAGTQAIEARTIALQAQEQARDTATRVTVAETRLNEVALQRSQLEALMQSLSRSRDENLVVDIESALRLAQQQAQLTGSLEPLVATLKSAQQRIERAAQPRLAPLQRALERDLQRITSASVTDTAGLLARLDDLVRQVDDLPLQNAVAQAAATRRLQARHATHSGAQAAPGAAQAWWETALQRSWEVVRDEVRGLVRVSRIDQPEAILLAPEQTFFLRENLKLKLLNARLGLLSRHNEAARADLSSASVAISRFFDSSSRRTQAAQTLLEQLISQSRALEVPRVEETLAALATAAAGR